jgi:prenylcysteine oxidase/farnesylcysteine lyase
MWRAVDEFNLTRRDFRDEKGMGIWDGEKLLFTANISSLWHTHFAKDP